MSDQEAARRFAEGKHLRLQKRHEEWLAEMHEHAKRSPYATAWLLERNFPELMIKDSIALIRKRESRLRKALWLPAASLSLSKEVVGIDVLLSRTLLLDNPLSRSRCTRYHLWCHRQPRLPNHAEALQQPANARNCDA
jgi:hypothetical protein